ncbi:CehA/McbA family metallohydrolase domain-containing protein [Horticoccus sp. 23ND18S-11]|uniref:hypothetical protein n=1 Tax=Horticoccus sp. 23ND18S-11 TaxID=3391832 RepID=UPI0039C99E73
MQGSRWFLVVLFSVLIARAQTPPLSESVPIDLSGVVAEAGVTIQRGSPGLRLTWPVGPDERGEILFNLQPNRPLIERLAIGAGAAGSETFTALMQRVDPVTLLTVGERDLRNPAGWVAFFDNPPLRAYQTVPAVLKKVSVEVRTAGSRTLVRIGDVTAGAFRGVLEFTVVRNSPLVHVETVLSTREEGRAILYDAGLVSPAPDWPSLAWRDVKGALQRTPVDVRRVVAPLHVRGRTVVAEGRDGGSVAVFPAPHRYFYPLDFADNLGFAWQGTSGNALLRGYGFGIRQPPEGDRRWVPWVNAPPGTAQRLGVFYFLSRAGAEPTLEAVARFTHGDRYRKLAGHVTFSSHFHIEHALEFLQARQRQATRGVPSGLEQPGFVKTFKALGVDIVHLGEFHVGGTSRLAANDRLVQLKALHDECARLSDGELLVLPGEEPNVHLGGHWMSFFPKPVYWVLNRARDTPFVEEVPGYGRVYHVGSADDVLRLMEQERGLMWTAHARIKGSRTFPDVYWETPFYRSDRFLGAAWKAMPSDLSQPRLGARVLDLLDDMANAGLRKHVLAEADLFRMEPDYETYAHMNVNYVRLERVPRFGDGWLPLLEALRSGRFFASTGEVLIPDFTVGGRESGAVLRKEASPGAGGTAELVAALEWTFPLAFAEIITGDGSTVQRQRIDLADTEAFGRRTLRAEVPLAGRKWVRFEAWDLAGNGAFTQPVWIE